jgi:hypothetical protein
LYAGSQGGNNVLCVLTGFCSTVAVGATSLNELCKNKIHNYLVAHHAGSGGSLVLGVSAYIHTKNVFAAARLWTTSKHLDLSYKAAVGIQSMGK